MTEGHWVTIDGRHVLIKSANVTGGGHQGTHDPATETGNKQVDAILKSRLQPAVKVNGKLIVGDRMKHHWELVPKHIGEAMTGVERGYVDPLTKKFYNAKKVGDTTELTRSISEYLEE